MELVVFFILLVLVVGLVLRDVEPRTVVADRDRDRHELRRVPEELPAEPQPRTDAAPTVADIVPVVGAVPAAAVVQEIVETGGFLQSETFEAVERARTLVATVRLLAVIIACGLAAGLLLLVVGRGIGLLIRRVSGA